MASQKIGEAILELLADGQPHTKQEIILQCMDELSSANALQVHICGLRKLLRPRGQDIICELVNRRINYRHIRLLQSASVG